MKVGRETWRNLPVIARGLIVAFAIIVILGTAVGSLLSRHRRELESLDEIPTAAAHAVWVLAALAFGVIVFRRRGRQ